MESTVTLQLFLEVTLASVAIVLLGRGVYRTWLDQLRRPITLLVWAFLTAILAGAVGGPPHPSPWWFALPAGILIWETVRGWTRVPRCHLREAALGALAAALICYIITVALAPWGALAVGGLSLAVGLALVGAGLLLRARHREPFPWRPADWLHYERRTSSRADGSSGSTPS